ncbi:MAG: hypothetical protein HY718_07900, partial [Planctomycetes bacterium]|nr:hypothetical protein [Planctomycetota bacterium]
MVKHACLVGLCLPWCMGVSCQISFPGDGDGGLGHPYVQLDRARAAITLSATTTGESASALASITSNGETVYLQKGQVVLVDGLEMLGPNVDRKYSRSVPKAGSYTIRVDEPTLGSDQTTIDAPADFSITAPADGASVSLENGFTLAWTNPDDTARYTITLSQTRTDGSRPTVVLGPASDAGGRVIVHADLVDFRQGANLLVKVTKFTEVADVGGFAAGSTLKAELSQTISLVPA